MDIQELKASCDMLIKEAAENFYKERFLEEINKEFETLFKTLNRDLCINIRWYEKGDPINDLSEIMGRRAFAANMGSSINPCEGDRLAVDLYLHPTVKYPEVLINSFHEITLLLIKEMATALDIYHAN